MCETIALDPLDMMSRNEAVLISRARGENTVAESQLDELTEMMAVSDPLSEIQAYLDIAFDYANAALWEEAGDLLSRLVDPEDGSAFPTVLYALGYFAHQLGRDDEGRILYERASKMPTDYCFPVRLEEMLILEHVQQLYPEDARVAYYLGNLIYDKKRYAEAIRHWERAADLDPHFATPWRNLGIAAYNVEHDPQKALRLYERAFSANPADDRVLSELDQVLARTGASPEERRARLEAHLDLVRDRDDLSVELATLYNQTGQPQKALDYMLSRRFHPWEGGTGRISHQYVQSLLLLGGDALEAGHPDTALAHFERALAPYPEVLGERKHAFRPDVDVYVGMGRAKQVLGDTAGAEAAFDYVLNARADGVSETTIHRAKALRALGRDEEAQAELTAMLENATARLDEAAKQGFATSVPEFVFAEADMETRRRIHLIYLIGLVQAELGRIADARASFEEVLELAPGHTEARLRLRALG